MSVNIIPRLQLPIENTMFSTSLVATRSPFNFNSPKNSPRLTRATSPKPGGTKREISAGGTTFSSCENLIKKSNLVASAESTTIKPMQPFGCSQCIDNQTTISTHITGSLNFSKLSIVDNAKSTFNSEKKLENTPNGAELYAITSTALANKLDNPASEVLVIDCRSFISYNLCHIKDSLNVGCADRLTKKRLASGKITLSQMIKCSLAKEKFLSHKGMDVVVYDDNSVEASINDSSLNLLMKALLREGKRVHFLKGGLAEFHSKYEELCEAGCAPDDAPLYSPTTPAIVTDEIDTATASKILPFLFIGNERDAANRERLRELGITHILNCTAHIPLYFEKDGISYHRLPASDSGKQNLKQYFLDAAKFIEDVRLTGGRVLVHCQAGVSRSATITMAYIMKHCTMKMHDVFKFVKSKRSIIAPNFNFMGQIMEFEQQLNEGKIKREEEFEIDFKPCS